MVAMRKTKSKPTRRDTRNQLLKQSVPEKIPFIAHIYELRKRLFYVGISVGIFGALAISVQSQLTALLLKPAGSQQFIYTTPGGGFDFAFKLCLYTGIAGSIPVIVYQLIRYLQPLIKQRTGRFVAAISVWSSILALAGIGFGYFFGLPAAMHFLLTGFSTEQIKALISIQSYLSFVMIYLLGSALLFQLPLVLIIINRFKPLSPKTLAKQQRWVILGAFIIGAVISPTPDIRNQLMLSGPVILMYELSIVIIWAINRKHRKPKKVLELLRKDAEIQAERLAKFEEARAMWRELLRSSGSIQPVQRLAVQPAAPSAAPAPSSLEPEQVQVKMPEQAAAPASRPRRYVQEFTRRPSYSGTRQRSPQA
jgi:sec-independent protein translocase protein TatC